MEQFQPCCYQRVFGPAQEHQVKSSTAQFTLEQMEKILKLFNSSNETPSCSFVKNGTIHCVSSIHAFNCTQQKVSPWIIDSGDHMTGCSSLFCSYKPCTGNKKARIANGSYSSFANGSYSP